MDIRRIAIGELRAAPYNPRVVLKPGDVRYERVARSIDEFDLVQPAVWNQRTGHIVGGHLRIEILRQRGVSEVDCVVVDLPPERERALNVALNNPAVGGEWEMDKLVDLLDELQSLPDFDATLTGFDDQHLRDLVLSPDEDLLAAAHEPELLEAGEPRMTVILEMPDEVWTRIESRIDAIVADEPNLEIHVRNAVGDL
jgi:ParB-like chromosome segregation protein Spo0J